MRKKKSASILKKFLVFNFTVFAVLGLFTILYLKAIQPNLVKNRASNHNIIIQNTNDHLQRLNVSFDEGSIKTFLLSTRFLFQSLDRVQFYSINGKLVGETNILDLDQSVFRESDLVIQESINGENLGTTFARGPLANGAILYWNIIGKSSNSKICFFSELLFKITVFSI